MKQGIMNGIISGKARRFYQMNQTLKKGLVIAASCFTLLGTGVSDAQVAPRDPAKPVMPALAAAHAHKSRSLDFIENKGQWGHGIRYQADIPDGTFFLTNEGFVYNFVKASDMKRFSEELEAGKSPTPNGLHYYAYKVNFVGGNASGKITNSGFDKRSYYNNYFIDNDPSKWQGHVGLYGKVKLGNVYNGIDAYVYSSVSDDKVSLKYDFVVAAGTNASDIQLSFEGVSPELNSDGALVIKTTVNEIVEQAPYCYQEINGRKVEVASKYVLDNGQLSFAFPNGYNHAYPLVVDPNLIFVTYSGGTNGPYYAHSTTYDTAGNTYGAALVEGSGGWPTTVGAYQTTFPGFDCVSINVYNPIGSGLIYSTYFGATSGSVEPNTLRVDADGNLVIAGSTSATTLPVTTGAYQPNNAGGNDIYVSKLSGDGSSLLASTYVGGSGQDASMIGENTAYTSLGISTNPRNPVEVAFDTLGNIWVTSNSSSIDFPTTANAAQSYMAGGTDAVVFKLNGNLSSLLYSTYAGGSGWDGGIAIEMDANGNPVFTGMTKSIDFPATSGAYYSYSQGGEDGFVARINPTTGAISEATYLGTSSDDDAERLAFDPDGNVYVAGRSVGGTYPVSAGAWSSSGGDIYIQKLSSDLSTAIKSTTLGASNSTIVASGFMVDLCGNMVIGIVASSTPQTGLDLTPDAFQTAAAPFYLAIVSRTFNDLIFGSYYGASGDHYHPGVSRLDKDGVFYQSVCNSTGAVPITPNAWSNWLSGSNDLLTFKFQFPPTGVQAHIQASSGGKDTVGCAPYTLHLGDASTSPYGITYSWNAGDGTPALTTADFTHTFTNPGTYTVVLNAHSDSACVTDDYDTFHVTVVHVDLPQITASSDTLLCNLETSVPLWVHISNPDTNNTIEWWPSNGVISGGASDTAIVDPTVNTYYVRVRDSIEGLCGFSTVDTVHIDFFPRSLTINTSDTTVCKGTQVQVDAQSAQGYTFVWSPINGVNDSTAINPVITANESMTYTLTAHHPGCLDTAQTLTINVQDYPVVDLGPNLEFCEWANVPLSANVSPYRSDYTYQWLPSSVGMAIPNSPNGHVTADSSGWYYLTVTTPVGCSGKDSVYLTVYPGNFGAVATDTGYCPPNEVHLWAAGAVHYKWTPSYGLSDTTIATPLANPSSTTNYTVYMEDVHGCKDTGNVLVTVYPSATLSIPDSITVYPGEDYHLEPATNCVYFNWFPTNGVNSTTVSDPVFDPSVRTRYFVTGKTENGCVVTDSMDVLVEGTVINMANAFTPGSGANGTYKVSKRGLASLKEFTVYNRWGNKVFSTTDINQGWDGSFNGKPQPTGVYIYTVEAVTDSGAPVERRGNVTLIR